MRKSKQETSETRQRIVTSASVEFRQNGIHQTALTDLMAAAGLTHGGFYRHFESKEQLVAECCGVAVDSMVETMEVAMAQRTTQGAIEALVASYLSTRHRDKPGMGCPISAQGSELARSAGGTRMAATHGILKLVDLLAKQFENLPPDAAKEQALVAFSTMVGALTLSRIVTDPELSITLLEQAERHLVQTLSNSI
jgi:TetR/AcrR family transcriptional repressor of nem operon